MTPKQERFVEEYLVDLNAAAAARRAGYSPKWADRQANNLMDRSGEVRDAIRRGLEEKRKQVSVSAEYVIEQLMREATFEGEGSSHSVRVRALEILGKHVGLFPANGRLEVALSPLEDVDTDARRIARRLILEEVRCLKEGEER